MSLEVVIFNPETLMEANNDASQAEDDAATKMANYENAKEETEDVLEELKAKYGAGEGKASEAKLGRIAKSTDRWRKVRGDVRSARLLAYQARATAKNADRKWRSIQTAISYIKEGMKRDVID